MQYAGIQILANACAPRISSGSENIDNCDVQQKRNEIGCIIMPCRKNEKGDAHYNKEAYIPIDHCKNCSFGECIRVFRLNLSLIQEKSQILEHDNSGVE